MIIQWQFDEARILPDPAVAGQNVGAWGQGVAMYGAARGYRCTSYNAYTDGQYVWL